MAVSVTAAVPRDESLMAAAPGPEGEPVLAR